MITGSDAAGGPRSEGHAPRPDPGGLAGLYGQFVVLLGAVSALLFSLIATLICVDVLLRLAGLRGLPQTTDLCEYALFAATFLGSPWVLRQGAHVRVDLLLVSLPPATARAMELIGNLFGLVVCGVLAWFGASALMTSLKFGTRIYKLIEMPEWPFLAIFTLCMVMLMIEFVLRLRVGAHDAAITSRGVGG